MLQDKVALITGAASGIGRAVALTLAREGARVVVSDVDAEGGRETVALIARQAGVASYCTADVSRAEDCRTLVAHAVQTFGRLDIACNNAGIGGELAPTADYPDEAWERVMAVNLSGVFYGMKHQIGQMRRQDGGGAIVNITSILGQVGCANAPAYTAAKHGVVGLTRTAALECGASGIRINAVGPAFIHTPMIERLEQDPATQSELVALHPLGRLGQPQEVAELVLWLASPRASFVSGSYHAVDGGYLAR